MATTAKIAKEAKAPKYKIRLRNRCRLWPSTSFTA